MLAAGLKVHVCCPVQREWSKHCVRDSLSNKHVNMLCCSELLGHLAILEERLPTLPHDHAPEENDMRRIISAIAKCETSTVCLLCQPCHTPAQLFIEHRLWPRGHLLVSMTLSNTNLTHFPLCHYVHDDSHCWRWSYCQIVTS